MAALMRQIVLRAKSSAVLHELEESQVIELANTVYHENEGFDGEPVDAEHMISLMERRYGSVGLVPSRNGFSLIELMITMGIMTIIMLGSMTMMQHMLLVNQTAEQKANMTSVVMATAGTAYNKTTCTRAITKVSQKYGEALQFGDLKNEAIIAEYRLTVRTLTYSDSELIETGYDGTKVYYGNLVLGATSNRRIYGGQEFATRTVASIYITADASGTITGCGAVAPVLAVAPVKTAEEIAQEAKDFEIACLGLGGKVTGTVCHISNEDGKK